MKLFAARSDFVCRPMGKHSKPLGMGKRQNPPGQPMKKKKKKLLAYIIENWDKLGHPKPRIDTYSSKQRLAFVLTVFTSNFNAFRQIPSQKEMQS